MHVLDEALLRKAGGDIVVTTPDDIDISATVQGRLAR